MGRSSPARIGTIKIRASIVECVSLQTALERSGKRQGRHAAGVIQRVQWDAYHSARRATRFAGETVGVADNDYGLADDDRGFAHGVNGLSRRAKRLTRCSIGVFLSFFRC